jgi:hypothetical protein
MKVSYNLDISDILLFNSFFFNKFVKWSFKYILTKVTCCMILLVFFHLISQNSSNVYIFYLGIIIALLSFFLLDNIFKGDTKKNIVKDNETSSNEDVNTIELIDDKVTYITPTAQLNINISEIQCIYYYNEYLFLFFSKISAIIIPKMKIKDGNIDELNNNLKNRYIEINYDKEMIKNDNCISFKNFHNSFKTDLFNWLKESKSKIIIYSLAFLIFLIIIVGYALWLMKDFK